ncbi:Alpha/Beta hydrolase protein [Jimgerdemannia flammicorona]|uniref:Alpha/Beta hydrolase protein n=1 Tax=Jimgerdemannia flammicorona TaxID=994334 RepID=A0A433D831_9FUNG|nr:Alpha/Beta hydrolase protein [Jimgerdemannia flammicorona]
MTSRPGWSAGSLSTATTIRSPNSKTYEGKTWLSGRFAWAFWNSSLETVHDNPLNRRGLYQMLSTVETHYGIRFPSGYNDAIRCFRLNLDSLNAAHRPFAFYALILAGTQLANVIFRWWGLERYGSETKGYYWSNTFEMDLKEGWGGVLTHSVAKGEPERIVYWHYNPQPLTDRSVPKRTPVVFVHGIGAGIMCYIEFLFRLLGLQREVFCVELPYVSMRLVEDVPTMQETVREIEQMLESHGHKQAVFVGHSLGSALLSWVIKNASKKVAGVVMIDPICFLLHYHDVAYNFVYRIPQRANEHIITFLASRELYISHYISRHFHWHQTAFFVPSTNPNPAISTTSVTPLPQRTTVFLSEHDNLVNSPRVDAYLRSHDVESHIMPNLDHASFLFSSAWKSRILNKIAEHCDAADAEIASLTVRVGGKSVRTSSGGKRRRKRSF